MRITTFSLASHVFAALLAAGATAAAAYFGGTTLQWTVGPIAAAVIAAGVGVFAGLRMRNGVHELSSTLSARRWDGRRATGFGEFDELNDMICEQGRRLSSTTTRTQEQVQEMQKLLAQLDRRQNHRGSSDRDMTTCRRLRDVLSSLVGAADSDLNQALPLMEEIEKSTREMAAGASDQSEAVSKTTTYVEQMSANIDVVSRNADAADRAASAVRECAGEALTLVRELIEGMERIRRHVEAGWRKLRGLGDRTQEIGSIVETIAGIAARTDMLALNASIESVRAGEHGRGFAVVADEVRKLAEQAAQATKEVGGLIESVQTETQESIDVMAQEHAQVETEVGRVNSAGESLERIGRTSSESAKRVEEISEAAQHQLRYTQEVVLAMERISDVAKGIRSRAEGVSWTTKSLSGLVRQLDTSLSPLRNLYTDDDPQSNAGDSNGNDNGLSEASLLRDSRAILGETRNSLVGDHANGRHIEVEEGVAAE